MRPTVLSLFNNVPQRAGGNESFARELSIQLGEQGWDSVLCFPEVPDNEIRGWFTSAGAVVETCPEAFASGPSCIAPLHRLLVRYRPRILHLHFMGFLDPHAWIGRLHGVRQIFFTDQGSRPEGHGGRRYPSWKRRAAWLISLPVTKCIPVSDYVLDCCLEQGILAADRVERIYNGVDRLRVVEQDPAAGAQFRQRLGIPRDRIVVMQMCWMIPEKGVSDLLAAAKLVCAACSGVHFVLAGDGPERSRYLEQAAALDLEEHVTFTGLVRDPFAEGAFAAADIVCLVSRWEEAFGWVIAEAMAHGRPVIGTDAGAIPSLVRHGETGLIVSRGRPDEIARAILELVRDSEARIRMGAAARADAAERFDLRNNVRRLLEIYGIGVQTPVSSAL
ncbi:MAG: glycosyltransferase family 4 protein [Bryobacterales bacterium]|nr:glycosyltransferase family 4 protein [Bryobacterales bacterium]